MERELREHTSGEFNRPGVEHEHSDINIRGVWIFIGALLVSAVVIHVLVWVLMDYLERPGKPRPRPAGVLRAQPTSRAAGPDVVPRRPIEGPPLQLNPAESLLEFKAREAEVLRQYGWVIEGGVIRPPIEDAMRLLAAAGYEVLPDAPAEFPTEYGPAPEAAPTESSAPWAPRDRQRGLGKGEEQ